MRSPSRRRPSTNAVGVPETPARTPLTMSRSTRARTAFRAAVAVEALEVDPEALRALPEVGIIDAAAIGVERVAHLPERALHPGGLRGGVKRRGPRVLRGHREVPEAEPQRQPPDLGPRSRAVGAPEVRVDDRLPPLPADVIVRADSGTDARVSSLIASKLAFAPVIVAQDRGIRAGLSVSGIAALVLALGFFQSADWATELWPWEDSPLSFIFLASILAAIALPALWIGVTGELAAIQARGARALADLRRGVRLPRDARRRSRTARAMALSRRLRGSVRLNVAAFAWSRRIPWRDERRMPNLVWVSFGALAVILTAAGAMLVLDADIFPWDLRSETSVIYGFIFLGATVFFAYGFLRPRWPNAAPPADRLPRLRHRPDRPVHRSLRRGEWAPAREPDRLHDACLLSAALAFHCLFVHEPTRLGSSRR